MRHFENRVSAKQNPSMLRQVMNGIEVVSAGEKTGILT